MNIFWFVALIALLFAVKFTFIDRKLDKIEKVQSRVIKDLSHIMADMGLVFTNLAIIIPTISKEKYREFMDGFTKITIERNSDIKTDKVEGKKIEEQQSKNDELPLG